MRNPTARSRATIIDIARLAGVSKSTVSLVLKGGAHVKRDTRDRVMSAMDALGYVYNRAAANLRMSRSNVVGMVISDLMNPFFAELAVGLEEAFYTAGLVPLLANTNEDAARQVRLLQSMHEHGAAGVIISPALDTDPATLADFARRGMPIVTAMRRLESSGLPYIGPDNRAGTRDCVSHLLGLGHRRIAFLGGSAQMTTQRERVSGYMSALNAAGIAYDSALVVDSRPTRDGGGRAIDSALAFVNPPTAAICYNDIVAIGAMGALTRRGLVVGRDFSIIGFDDIAEAKHAAPPLTTVTAFPQRLGAQAADLLLDLIAGKAPPSAVVIGETRLTIRESCGIPIGHRRRAEA